MRIPDKFRATFVFIVFVISFVVHGAGQTRVDNPRRALAKNAGRVVKLEEVLRIRDDGEKAIFRTPQNLALGPDGSLDFLDFSERNRLYRYGPDGRLIFKILKSGQGPGECQYATLFFMDGDRIRVHAWGPPKIMDFGPDGRYLREVRIDEDTHGLWFLGATGGKIYGIRSGLFSSAAFKSAGDAGVVSIPNSIYEISPDFKTWKKLYEFPVRMVIKRANGVRLDMIDAAIGGSTLYLLHTAEYRVVAFDLRTGRVERIITRAYDRVKARAEKATDPDPETKGIDLPDDPYVWDIDRIHAAAGKLLVFTSTLGSGGNDQQVDVFDESGRFIDNVILRFPAAERNHRARWTVLTDDGFFIIPEQEKDGLITIGKYRIVDADLFPPGSATGDIRVARRGQ
jgi:hypothetical protein